MKFFLILLTILYAACYTPDQEVSSSVSRTSSLHIQQQVNSKDRVHQNEAVLSDAGISFSSASDRFRREAGLEPHPGSVAGKVAALTGITLVDQGDPKAFLLHIYPSHNFW